MVYAGEHRSVKVVLVTRYCYYSARYAHIAPVDVIVSLLL